MTYTYDANGNLIKQSGDKEVDYTYDQENHLLKAAIQKGNSVTIESYTLGEERITVEQAGKTWYYLYDGHGNVRSLSDEQGKLTDHYDYDAYGNLLEKAGNTKNDFLYTGEQYNAGTGLYYLRARYMNPATGTFISMDSYQGSMYDPVSLHKYLYANADPVKYVDPSGYTSVSEFSVASAMQSALNGIKKLNNLTRLVQWADAVCTIYDTAILRLQSKILWQMEKKDYRISLNFVWVNSWRKIFLRM